MYSVDTSQRLKLATQCTLHSGVSDRGAGFQRRVFRDGFRDGFSETGLVRHPGECLPPGINMTSINTVVMAVWMYSLHTLARKALAGDMGIVYRVTARCV